MFRSRVLSDRTESTGGLLYYFVTLLSVCQAPRPRLVATDAMPGTSDENGHLSLFACPRLQ